VSFEHPDCIFLHGVQVSRVDVCRTSVVSWVEATRRLGDLTADMVAKDVHVVQVRHGGLTLCQLEQWCHADRIRKSELQELVHFLAQLGLHTLGVYTLATALNAFVRAGQPAT